MHIEEIQEGEYDFPYHHLVDVRPFSETKHLFWGYKYGAYLEKILDTVSKYKFDSLIDIGCGDGKVIIEIARRFPDKKLVGVDYSEKSLRFARAFAPHLTFTSKSEDTFDGFVLIEVIEHIDPNEMDTFLDSVTANLKPGAFGVISTPCDNMPLIPKHFQHFNKESITKTLEKHFEIVSFEYTAAQTFGVYVIGRLLANRFFILNNRSLIRGLYNFYKKHYLIANSTNATQVFIVVKKK